MPFLYSPKYLPQPKIQLLGNGELYAVMAPFLVIRPNGMGILVPPSGLGTEEEIIKSPTWVTDLGSIPMVFQNLVEKSGPNTAAYITHDWLYCSEMFDRLTCDDVLKEMCVKENEIIFEAVRLGGGEVWAKHDPINVTMMKAYYKAFLDEVPTRWPELLIAAPI